jgi:hypothetical protein
LHVVLSNFCLKVWDTDNVHASFLIQSW